MKKITLFFYVILCSFIVSNLNAQNFSQSNLDFNGFSPVSSGVTSLMFGPDGRLYVAEYPGTIKIYTIQRVSATNYQVIALETLTDVKDITNHDDDGTACSGSNNNCNSRETIGITVGGTASNPVFYVSSSDFRIGAGSGGGNGDVDLDTNSGVITCFSWNGNAWNVVDIVRGLPRSEENHATNGLELATINNKNYLLVAQGGNTNAGGPSVNFVFQTEYALSAAILAIDLDALAGMQEKTDQYGRKYIYDIPTLDDPTRANVNGITDPNTPGYNGIDVNDPWGGNDGLNQAMLVDGGPVKIFSPGYRNSYDIVLTENGSLYATDNGANGGWGGFPLNEGGGSANNNYSASEPGSSSNSGNEKVDNKDHLELIALDINNYTFGSFYGGHPVPIRANPSGAGLYTALGVSNNGAVFRTKKYDPNGSTSGSTSNANIALPANWPPVPLNLANSIEGDWRGPTVNNPDGPEDNPILVWGTNTNGIDEYTASNFNGAMKGDLVAGHSGGNVRRVELKGDGTVQNYTDKLFSGISGDPLGITCNSDTDAFPGTIWVGTLGGTSSGNPSGGTILVYEPLDFSECIEPGEPGYSTTTDGDFDGYSNGDEEDNETDVCNGGSQPDDFDKAAGGTLVSNLNDNDDDADGIPDAQDPFQLGDPTDSGSDAFTLPVNNGLFNFQQGLGGIFGLGMTGLMNNGDTGANWMNWLDRKDDPNDPNPNDVLGGAPGLMTSHMTSGTALGNTNTQEKGYQYGVQVSTQTGKFMVVGGMNGFTGSLRLYGNNAATGGELGFFIGDGTQSNYIQFIVTVDGFEIMQEINDNPQTPITLNLPINQRPTAGIQFYFVVDPSNGKVECYYEIDASGNRIFVGAVTAQGSILNAIQQSSKDLAVGFIGTSNTPGVELEGTWDFLNVILEESNVLYRVNCGGPTIAAIDGDIPWQVDTKANKSTYLTVAGSNTVFSGTINSYSPSVDLATTPTAIFNTERFDFVSGAPNMKYEFPVTEQGNYEVRIYMGNGYSGTSQAGQRLFDISIEGNVPSILNDIDLSGDFGHSVGSVISQVVNVTDGIIDIEFIHGSIENPLVNGIEILGQSELSSETPIVVSNIANQSNIPGDALNGSLAVQATGGDGNLSYLATGLPPGITIEPTNGVIGGTIGANAAAGSPYTVNITVDDSDASSADAQTINFTWTVNTVGNNLTWLDKNENENYIARHECSFVQAGNKFFLMGGRESATTINIYDYTSNSWIALSNSAPFQFNHYQAIEYQGLIWIIGAFKTNNYPNETPAEYVWMFNPATQEWFQGPQIPTARQRGSAGVVVYNNKFYIVGGNTDGHDGGFVNMFDEFDPATGAWTTLTNAPFARDHFAAVVIGNKLYVAAGRQSDFPDKVFSETIAEVDVYDFGSGTWSTLPSAQNIPTPRGGASAVNFNNKLVVIGGEVENQLVYGEVKNDALKITEEYDPGNQQWSRLADLNYERHGTQAIVSGMGLYILGGSPNKGGGKQKNMEVLGSDAPQGVASVASNLSVPNAVAIADGSSKNIAVTISGGNVGVFVQSIEITGADAGDFSISSGDLTNSLLTVNATHTVQVALNKTSSGEKNATLTVTYNDGTTESVSLSSEETPDANPVAIANSNVTQGDAPLTVNFNGSSSTDDAAITAYAWVFGDGGTSNQENPSYTYNNAGNYTAQLTVTDGDGLTDTATIEITVNDPTVITAGVSSFTLVNSTTNADVTTITNGLQIDLGENGGEKVNIRANTTGSQSIGSVDLVLSGPVSNGRVEGVAPYALFGDVAGNYLNANLPLGDYTLTATAYSGGNKKGNVVGNPLVVQFSIVAEPINQPPVAVVNADVTSGDAPLSVNFTGSNSTDDTAVTGYAWVFGDGGTATDADPSYTYTTAGTYTAQLTVSDGENLTNTATIEITVTDPPINQPPVAIIGTDVTSGETPLNVSFTGSNSTDDTAVTAYAWTFGDGGTSTDADPSYTYTVAGTYTAQLTVSDGENLTNSTTVEITVTEPLPNQAPVAQIDTNTTSGEAPLTVNFTGSNSTDDSAVTSYAWEFGDGGTSTEADPSYTYNNVGTYTAQLTVSDGENLTNSTTVEITVSEPVPNQPPVAVINTDTTTGDAPLNVSFTGSNSTDDESISSYAWTFGDGGTSTEADPSYTYAAAGNYTAELTVTDSDGETNTTTVEITVNQPPNQPPVAVVSANVTAGNAPLVVNFTGNNSTDDVAVTSYAWTFGDGGTATTANPSYTYTTPGNYTASLTVSDAENLTNTATINIVVNDPTVITEGVESFTLINAITDADITTITNGLQINLGENGAVGVNVRANTVGAQSIGSVALELTGPVSNSRVEGVAPYALYGDVAGNYLGTTLPLGDYTLVATAYSGGNKKGNIIGDPLTVLFSIVTELVNQPPVAQANANITAGDAPLSVNFTGSNSTDDVGIVSYTWTFGDGGTATTANPSYLYTTPGMYTAELTVSDGEFTNTDSVVITVTDPNANEPPTAVANANLTQGETPLAVQFTGSNSTDDNGISTYAWAFGDGGTSALADPSYTYTTAGSFNAVLTVTDAEGLMDTETISITVTNPAVNNAPNVTNPGNQNSNEGETVSLPIIATDESSNLTYQATGLPPGLAINPTTGVISGTITQGQGSGAFMESNGLVVIEAESGSLVNNWSITNAGGATGILAGKNSFSNINGGVIPYQITISTPGVYRFNWRSFFTGSNSTEENDNWLRFPNNNNVWFFGIDESSGNPGNEAAIIANLQGAQSEIVFPKGSSRITGSTTPAGSGAQGYFKIYRAGGSSQTYSWQARTSDNDTHAIYVWFVNAGTYTMEISERSKGHAIDKMALYKVDTYGFNYNASQLTNTSESQRSNATVQGAAVNSPYNVQVTVTDDANPALSSSVNFIWTIGTDTPDPIDPPTSGQTIASLTLIDADADVDILNIQDGQQIEQSVFNGAGLNVRANTNPSTVGSVAFVLSGPVNTQKTENVAPYALFGDFAGDYNPQNLPLGNYTLTATPYTGSSKGGQIGTPLTVNFSITNLLKVEYQNTLNRNITLLELSPNPVAGETAYFRLINANALPETIYLFDITGRLVQTYARDQFGDIGGSYSFETGGLEEGLYLVKVELENGMVLNSKLMKEK